MADVSDDAHYELRNALLNDDVTYARRIAVVRLPNSAIVSYLGGDRDITVNLAVLACR